jgi:hypothetical protein
MKTIYDIWKKLSRMRLKKIIKFDKLFQLKQIVTKRTIIKYEERAN